MQNFGVLFVCTGNICRSPLAEGVFRHRVEAAGLAPHFHIDSAGTHGYHTGEAPDPRSIAAAAARGIDIRGLRARQFKAADVDRFDLVLAMDRGHYSLLERYVPAIGLEMFMKDDVPDPYYGQARDFEQALDMIETGVDALFARIRRRLEL